MYNCGESHSAEVGMLSLKLGICCSPRFIGCAAVRRKKKVGHENLEQNEQMSLIQVKHSETSMVTPVAIKFLMVEMKVKALYSFV
jgi:hypothetical protein